MGKRKRTGSSPGNQARIDRAVILRYWLSHGEDWQWPLWRRYIELKEGMCFACGLVPRRKCWLERHHIIPWRESRRSRTRLLHLLCKWCHDKAPEEPLDDYKRWLASQRYWNHEVIAALQLATAPPAWAARGRAIGTDRDGCAG